MHIQRYRESSEMYSNKTNMLLSGRNNEINKRKKKRDNATS